MIHTFNMSVTSIPATVSKSTAENRMTVKTTALFVPILTVLAEVGGPFIYRDGSKRKWETHTGWCT